MGLLEMLNVGIVGAGRMGQLYARVVAESPLARLCAVVGNSLARRSAFEVDASVPFFPHGDLAAMWAVCPEIDTIIVATPEWAHLAPVLDALGHGAHMLLEKPIAHCLDDARRITLAARPAGGTVMPCHPLRFDSRYTTLKQALDRGALGEVRHIYARRNADQHAAQRILGRCHPAYWLAPHDVDMVRWLTGAEVVRVCAHAAIDGRQAADAIVADLRLSNGALARIENSWVLPHGAAGSRETAFDVWGSGGRAQVSPQQQGLLMATPLSGIDSPDTVDSPAVQGRLTGTFPAMVQHFLQAASSGRQCMVTIEDAFAAIVVSAAMERSLNEGREVAAVEP